tara:strand:+ start:176 stop:421 length:246 start_codon:yes stop_codon:yes gene_type:complete
MREMLLAAIKSYYVGNINKHIANIEVYLRTSVGIGEHSDIIESIDKEMDKVAMYDDKIAMVVKYFERKQEDEKKETKPKSK